MIFINYDDGVVCCDGLVWSGQSPDSFISVNGWFESSYVGLLTLWPLKVQGGKGYWFLDPRPGSNEKRTHLGLESNMP